mmetsp:Transcript_32117/g.44528  ORF Transcript_32117/g.44528 Transcript_32117/m.44528 type:complete len:246 (-) Transcript_32117:238-975(-)|eukprot:CAMPEP_0196585342 /NCGR_PEP_ID=MMETSP1081-20130531/50318_1 /TAXON_ID=36882 /ORGANISM="Pyramimonas amylifera, Strain CCMP720" /LENGTH=245 /DNA_ID=CAMNT_0041906857 /DNA_START=255 /DNA_END=992 /DNA_ORIENTATION=+
MLEEDFEREIKVLLVGNGGVGKTSMIRRFCRGIFTDEYKKTIGVDFLEKTQYIDALGDDVRMMLWDTAGQEEFDSMTRTYYRGAGACVIAFSTTDRESFDAVLSWKKKVEAECGNIAMVLVQNKVDLIDQAVMSAEEAEAMARKVGLKFYRACVKENLNVTEVFKYLAELNDTKTRQGGAAAPPPISGGIFEKPTVPTDSKVAKAAAATTAQPGGETFTIQGPSKQRTGGKKKLTQKLGTACSLL